MMSIHGPSKLKSWKNTLRGMNQKGHDINRRQKKNNIFARVRGTERGEFQSPGILDGKTYGQLSRTYPVKRYAKRTRGEAPSRQERGRKSEQGEFTEKKKEGHSHKPFQGGESHLRGEKGRLPPRVKSPTTRLIKQAPSGSQEKKKRSTFSMSKHRL